MEIEKIKEILVTTIPRMIDTRFYLSDNLKPVYADPTQIEQIIMNLVINARDAMADGGRLVLQTENVFLDEKSCRDFPGFAPGEYDLLAISDTGMGMDNEIIEHIFEPFYTTKEIGKGTGLGLAMVYGIVKNHNGFIYCESIPGQGTTFKIYLPVIEAKSQEPGAERKCEKEMPAGGSETILLVDDEEAILEIGREFLEHSGYTVITAESGEDAIEIVSKAHTSSPDVVILDLNMPGMGGYECLQEIVKIDSGLKVLIASGYSAEFQEKKIREMGARGFIAKPYQMKQALKIVREMLDERS